MARLLHEIHIKGFKSIQNQRVVLGDINVLIGANGAGKSNFIGVFRFLRQLVEQQLQQVVREVGGAEHLLFYGSKTTPEIELELKFEHNQYSIVLSATRDDGLFVNKERAAFHDKSYPKPYWEEVSSASLESAIKDYGYQSKVAAYTYSALKTWRVYHFHDTSDNALVKKRNDLYQNTYLKEDAANLAAFLYRMQEENHGHYRRIVRTVQMVAPMFNDFHLRPDPFNPDTIRFEWLDNKRDYIFRASDLSDGTLRFICIVTMLLQPNPPELLLLDEPELGLHPSAIVILANLLQKVSDRSQIIISTQSPALVSQFLPEDVIVVEQQENSTLFKRLEEENLQDWLAEYSLGDLWTKNVLGGRP